MWEWCIRDGSKTVESLVASSKLSRCHGRGQSRKFVFCILYSVFVFCILYSVCVFCICILYSYSLFVFCICVLYLYSVFLFCICTISMSRKNVSQNLLSFCVYFSVSVLATWYCFSRQSCDICELVVFDISIWNIDCRYIDTIEKYRYRYW